MPTTNCTTSGESEKTKPRKSAPSCCRTFTPALILAIFTAFFAWFVHAVRSELKQIQKEEGRTQHDHFQAKQNITIVDNFLPTAVGSLSSSTSDLLQTLQDRSLWEACSESEVRWVDKRGLAKAYAEKEVDNIWGELAELIWESQPEYYHQAEGFEFWCNILTREDPLNWHLDKDEQDAIQNQRLSQPLMGAVYYGYDHTFMGGLLRTLDVDASEDPTNKISRGLYTETTADFNRLILFNASLWHSVSDVLEGERFTFAVNAWKKKPYGMGIGE